MIGSKEHILKTSFCLFLQKSFKEVTMNEIVTASGLSKGAFYHHFQSKEQLFVEVINTFFFGLMIVDYKKLNQNSLREFYHEYAAEIRRTIAASGDLLNICDTNLNLNYLTMMFDAMKLFPGFQEKVRTAQKEELAVWSSVVGRSRANGEFTSPMSDEQIARMFIYSNDGIALHLMLNGNINDVEREMISLWDTFYLEIKD
jgi:TetR/AcrR family transcriptional regulator, transcriptional repressor for nem operon